ncbi:MAG: hypothetical protein K0Q51_147 [Rickettsiaceae bacterium]|jgi:hypothetical protein|nr:hypothetical protein [Rickettsiaceae bacterium]
MKKLELIKSTSAQAINKYSKYLLPLTVGTIFLLANTAEAAEIPIIQSIATSTKDTLTGSVRLAGEALAVIGTLFHYITTKNPYLFGTALGAVGTVELVLPLLK